MDIYCSKCGEPWDTYTLTDEGVTIESFSKNGCKVFGVKCNENTIDKKNSLYSEIYDILGDDVDGAASIIDDAKYLGLI